MLLSETTTQTTPQPEEHQAAFDLKKTLKLLSYNIQVGIETDRYHHYVTKSWQHVLPSSKRINNLQRIAELIQHFDIVALQEADGGSLRSGFINQVEYLAHYANFPYWYQQSNRNLGKFAQPGNGLLSRYQPYQLEDHRLPSRIPGRGAIIAFYGDPKNPLVLVLLHLSLGRRAQCRQLAYLHETLEHYSNIVIMGDLNSRLEKLSAETSLKHMNLVIPDNQDCSLNTFPSWKPNRAIDHILVSPNIHISGLSVLPHSTSDHLPIAMEIHLGK